MGARGLGLLAGRDLTPARLTSIHWRHVEAGATIQWAGPWKRPYAYGDKPEDEVRAVHESLGVIDVSTLGKLVEGRAPSRSSSASIRTVSAT